jgi:hypothetical protein
VGFVFNIFGIACIMVGTAGSGYLFLANYPDMVSVDDPIPPTVALGVISGLTGAMFLSIFSYSSDAILQAFLLDEELRFLGDNRPAYMMEFAEAMKKRGQGACESSCPEQCVTHFLARKFKIKFMLWVRNSPACKFQTKKN